jgi:tetratricopeptide (TPR) repeat protein
VPSLTPRVPKRRSTRPATSPSSRPSARSALPLLALLAAVTLATFAGVLANDWTFTDDPYYVFQNSMVVHGLHWESVAWAFRGPHGGNWHPLTSLAHLAAVSLFGLQPAGHHAVSWALHAVNAVLVALVFQAYWESPWRSLLVASLFALHPLRVESVAWISELKDVLCGTFFLASLLAYRRWVARPSRPRYGVLAAAFALALMAKPMAVTLPAVLLLLDAWPLGRLAGHVRERLIEKAPLASLAVADAVLTVMAQHASGAVASVESVGWPMRLANAALAPWRYLLATFWPAHLAIFHPYQPISPAAALLAFLGLVLITWLAWTRRRSMPYLAVGWLWFLAMLAPVLGILQVGSQAYADRYTYLPTLGLLLALVWGVSDGVALRPAARRAVIALSCVALAALALTTRRQVSYWRNTQTIYAQALAVTPDNPIAECSLGAALLQTDSLEAAVRHIERALVLKPGWAYAEGNLGVALVRLGRFGEAIPPLEHAARSLSMAMLHDQLAVAYANLGRIGDAEAQVSQGLRLEPSNVDLLVHQAQLLAAQHRFQEAKAVLDRAAALDPSNEMARRMLAQIHDSLSAGP